MKIIVFLYEKYLIKIENPYIAKMKCLWKFKDNIRDMKERYNDEM